VLPQVTGAAGVVNPLATIFHHYEVELRNNARG